MHKIEAEVSVFFQNIQNKFKLANLIITRSGGSTVAEILASCRPAIFVPLPSSFDNHQFENAKFFETNKCGWVFDQINNSKSDFQKLIKLEMVDFSLIQIQIHLFLNVFRLN